MFHVKCHGQRVGRPMFEARTVIFNSTDLQDESKPHGVLNENLEKVKAYLGRRI